MMTEPRQVIDSFLNGIRGSFLHPILFCVIGTIIVMLLNYLFVDFSFTPQTGEAIPKDKNLQRLAEWTQIISVRAATQFLPLTMLFLMIFSLSVGGILFLKGKTGGFFDHLVINTYAVGASLLFLIVMIPVWQLSGWSLLDPVMNSILPAAITAGVILWIYRLYFHVESFMGWIRILSSYITGFFLYTILAGFLSSVIGYMIFAVERLAEISG